MLYYLERTETEFTEVSARLGFAEQSAMTHYCRKCFGKSPTQLRIDLRRPPA